MAQHRIPRKTAAESRAYERLAGYGDCLKTFTDAWRERVWKYDRQNKGHDAVANAMWEQIQFADCEHSRLDTAYKRLAHPRLYGSDPKDFEWGCHCGNPGKHPQK